MNAKSKYPCLAFVTSFVMLFLIGAVEAQSRIELKEAVEEFNQAASLDPIGKSQPPLTVDEVIAAIRLMDVKKYDLPEEGKVEFRAIAKEDSIDAVDRIYSMNSWGPLEIDGELYQFEIWWVDLRIERDSIMDKFGRTPSYFNLRVRDRTISSRKLTESETEEFRTLQRESKMLQEELRLWSLHRDPGK